MLTNTDLERILRHVAYKPGWRVELRQDQDRPYLQVQYPAQDWTGRKWMLSRFMTPSEVVQTAFKAIMTAEEHETREAFKYKDQAIFGPHYDVDKLAELAFQHPWDIRPNAMQGV